MINTNQLRKNAPFTPCCEIESPSDVTVTKKRNWRTSRLDGKITRSLNGCPAPFKRLIQIKSTQLSCSLPPITKRFAISGNLLLDWPNYRVLVDHTHLLVRSKNVRRTTSGKRENQSFSQPSSCGGVPRSDPRGSLRKTPALQSLKRSQTVSFSPS